MRRAITVLLSLAVIGGSTGAATALSAGAPPPNDTVDGASVVVDLPFTDTLDISTATSEPEDEVAGCYGQPSTTVWYRFTPAQDVIAELSTAGSDFDTTLELYTGPDLALVECDDEGDDDGTSRLRPTLTAGQTYFVRAAGFSSSTGTLVFSLRRFVSSDGTPPGNDTIAGATAVPALPFDDTVDVRAATSGPEDGVGECFGPAASTVWYRYTPAEDVVVDVSTAGSDFDTTLEVFSASDMSTVECDDDSGSFSDSELRAALEGGQEYLVRAAGFADSSGTLVLSVRRFVPIEVAVSVADTGRLTPGGRAVVDVTLTCNRPTDVFVSYDGRQALGPLVVSGTAVRQLTCQDRSAGPVQITGGPGGFLPGLFDLAYAVTACEPGTFLFEGCVDVEGTETVVLVPGP